MKIVFIVMKQSDPDYPEEIFLKLTKNRFEYSFDLMRYSMYWIDERPDGLWSDEYNMVVNLTAYRSFKYHYCQCGIQVEDIHEDFIENFDADWAKAKAEMPYWYGFERLDLTQKEKEFLTKEIKQAELDQAELDQGSS